MSSNDAVLTRKSKTRALLFKFVRGSESPYLYTDYPINISVLNDVYVSLPEIVAELPTNTGGLDDGTFRLDFPLIGLTAAMSNGDPQPDVTIEVREWYMSRTDGRADVTYIGTVDRAVRNVNGDPGRVRLECSNVKSRLDIAAGIPATAACNWIFTRRGCGVMPVTSAGFIASIAGPLVTITGVTPATPIGTWRRGFIEYVGLKLMIRDFDGVDQFLLSKQPPHTWLNRTVTVNAGCDRLAATCLAVWNNLVHFGGFGYAIPDYHPIIEAP